MKKLIALIMFGGIACLATYSNLYARITTAGSTDVWCVGPSGAEVCVDSSGNLLPTTTSDTTLGTSSLYWATLYADDVTVSDDLTVTDDASVGGDLDLSANLDVASGVVIAMASSGIAMQISNSGLMIGSGLVIKAGTYQSTNQQNSPLTISDASGNPWLRVAADGGLVPRSRTKAQLQAFTPLVPGSLFFCSDCSNGIYMLVATSISKGGLAAIGSGINGAVSWQ